MNRFYMEPDQIISEQIARHCGHCGRDSWFTRRAAVWGGRWLVRTKDERPLIAAIYQCGGCERGSLFVFQTYSLAGGMSASLLEAYPAARALRNEDLPVPIDADRMEAWDCFFNGQYKAATLMARSALQRAVRTLDEFRGMLKPELDNLVKKSIITQQLRDNAEEVRVTGNDVAHPEELGEVSEEDAKDSLIFVDDFLNTTLAIPARQRARRAKRESKPEK